MSRPPTLIPFNPQPATHRCGQGPVAGPREYIAAALKDGAAWVDYYWYKPGQNTPSRKQTYVRRVQSGEDIFIVGSGFYLEK